MSTFNSFFNFFKDLGQSKRERADETVRSHVLWALGAGLVPLPLLDFAAVTAVQVDMARRLAEIYSVPYDEKRGKAIITALISTSLATLGASFVKAIPILGSIVGGAGMAVLSGGATYAVGQVFIRHFEGGGSMDDFNMEAARRVYEDELERGKTYASNLQREEATRPKTAGAAPNTSPEPDPLTKLERLSELKAKGIITEEEYQAKKQELLSQV